MKWIKYQIVCGQNEDGEDILLDKKIGYSSENYAIAEEEAYNGCEIIEDTESFDKEPLAIEFGGTNAKTAEEARRKLGAASSQCEHNVNILDNWYFADPVCQRAGYYATFAGSATSIPYYTDSAFKTQGGTWSAEKQLSGGNADCGWLNAGGVDGTISYYVKPENLKQGFIVEAFCIDRWSFEHWNPSKQSVQLRNGCVAIVSGAAASTNNTTKLRQTVVNPSRLAGKTVTFSAKLKNVTVNGNPRLTIYYGSSKKDVTITSADANSIISVTATLPTTLSSMYVAIGNDGNAAGKGNFDIEIESVKLEIGSVSTLANDAPPKKSEQLLECQRYFIRFASDGGQWLIGASNGTALYAPLHLPVPLQGTAVPTIRAENVNIYPYVSGGSVAVTSLSLSSNASRQSFMLCAQHTSGDLASKEPGALRFATGGFLSLSCEV